MWDGYCSDVFNTLYRLNCRGKLLSLLKHTVCSMYLYLLVVICSYLYMEKLKLKLTYPTVLDTIFVVLLKYTSALNKLSFVESCEYIV